MLNKAAMNMGEKLSLGGTDFIFLWYLSIKGVAGLSLNF
jgi:hypothetical protein